MIGDTDDMASRIRSVIPAQWFADDAPNLQALLKGLGRAWSGLYKLLKRVKNQARIQTASGIFLDLVAKDYLGSSLPRRSAETDESYRSRILASVLQPRATRQALVSALTQLTGKAPQIFEPFNATDTGGYNLNLGYNTLGGYGCLTLPFQFFVTAYNPSSISAIDDGGYGCGPGGYNTSPMFYASLSEFSGKISNSDIYAGIAAVIPTASIAWTKIIN